MGPAVAPTGPPGDSPLMSEQVDEAVTGAPADAGVAPALDGVARSTSGAQEVLHPARDRYLEVAAALRDAGYGMCVDLCAVDYLLHMERALPEGVAAERFEVVANLLSLEQRRRVRLRVQVPEHEPVVPSLFDLYPGTEAMEREAFDMFGIVFSDH